ncbi:uncharacterized protein LOC143577686 [Bidens hawaiensis]|uniref:uncharacterized protein LOC143577686 n=1 Tax=Bidens hawaiensis TaxID=980011 RepID=UPI004049953C
MGSYSEPDPYYIPRLSLFSITTHIPEPSGTKTPPLQPAASVPFQWEEQPGKPRPCTDIVVASTQPNKRLDLPPRLTMTDSTKPSLRSPTTVLDGPGDLGGKPSSFRESFRFPKRRRRQKSLDSNFSDPWSPSWLPGEQQLQRLLLPGSKIDSPLMTPSMDAGFVEGKTKMRRNSSMSKVSGSHIWAKIYEGFKRVVIPWRKKPKMESFIF